MERLLLCLTVLAVFLAAVPVSAANGGGHPAEASAEAFLPPDGSSAEVEVAVAPPGDITFGQALGDPSAVQRDLGSGVDRDAVFTYRYVGVDGTDYDSAEKPRDAGRYQVVAVLDSATHSGEGVSGSFTIRRADSKTVRRVIPVPTADGTRTVFIGQLDLPADWAQGAKLKEEPVFTEGKVLRSGALTADGAAFTLETKAAEPGETQKFRFVLETDNCWALTVVVEVTASLEEDEVEITGVRTKEPGTFRYGTTLRNIIDLGDCAASVNGESAQGRFELAEPGRCYGVGESKEIAVRFVSGDRVYTRTVPAEFTVEPAHVTPVGWDGQFFRDGYWITTYANSPYNTSVEMLGELVRERKRDFRVDRGSTRIRLDADWSADSGNPAFEPQGQRPHQVGDVIWYDWYVYTAALSSRKYDAASLDIGVPKAYVRVVPVTAAADLGDGGRRTVSAAELAALTEEDWRAALALPETAEVSFEPVERPQWSDEYVPTPGGTYAVTGWQLDGRDLTLSALKAAGAAKGGAALSLTPVYEGIPGWATVLPAVELTVTP